MGATYFYLFIKLPYSSLSHDDSGHIAQYQFIDKRLQKHALNRSMFLYESACLLNDRRHGKSLALQLTKAGDTIVIPVFFKCTGSYSVH